MGATAKVFVLLCIIPTFRTHGIRLIIILALAYLLQQGYQKGNKKPKSLWKRSAGDPFNSVVDKSLALEHPPHKILQHALDLDLHECAQHAMCRVGMREARGEKLSENESVLLNIIFRNRSEPIKSRGEEAFQAAVEYGHHVYGDENLCQLRYKKCPHRGRVIDSFLISMHVT